MKYQIKGTCSANYSMDVMDIGLQIDTDYVLNNMKKSNFEDVNFMETANIIDSIETVQSNMHNETRRVESVNSDVLSNPLRKNTRVIPLKHVLGVMTLNYTVYREASSVSTAKEQFMNDIDFIHKFEINTVENLRGMDICIDASEVS